MTESQDPPRRDVCAVIVAYEPDYDHFVELLGECLAQCAGVVLVNNGDPLTLSSFDHGELTCIQATGNIGLAAAQNLGVAWAAAQDYPYVWFIDQDSWPAAGLVQTLRLAFEELESAGATPAAVGPSLIDHRDGVATPFVRFTPWGISRFHPTTHTTAIACDFLIASGMLTSVARFHVIGPWEEALFIDNVDLEWSFRARASGFPCFGVSTARLSHTLGDAVTRFTLLGRTHTLYFHAPLRQYYMMRNRIALYRRRYIPLAWKLQDIPRAVVKTLLFALVVRPRRENARYLLKGIIDGYLSRLGPLPE